MPVALNRGLLSAQSVRRAVREIRSGAGSDRDKKEQINAWFGLRDFETRYRYTRAEAVRALWDIDPVDLAEQRRELERVDKLDRDIVSTIRRVARGARLRVHQMIFGNARLTRLGG